MMQKTEIIKVNPKKPDLKSIKKAAEIIKKGGLVAFPTETVYGLGAAYNNPDAVTKIYEVKNNEFKIFTYWAISIRKEGYKHT